MPDNRKWTPGPWLVECVQVSDLVQQINAASAILHKRVRFAHQSPCLPSHTVMNMTGEGMVELDDMTGHFAPHLFVVEESES